MYDTSFDAHRAVHLSIILVINLMLKILLYNKLIKCFYMFRALCAHHQEVKILLYGIWYHYTYRCNDTRGCVMQF